MRLTSKPALGIKEPIATVAKGGSNSKEIDDVMILLPTRDA